MSTNEALLTNCRAIQLVDDLDPDAAHALFRQNYRAHPSLMTSVNYAAFLMDEQPLSADALPDLAVRAPPLQGEASADEICQASA